MRILRKEDVEINVYEYGVPHMPFYDEIPFNVFDYAPDKRKSKKLYTSIWGAFDIETTPIRYKEVWNSIMYLWQFAFGDLTNLLVVVGRTWRAYQDFLMQLQDRLYVPMPVYVHNLGYEFEFLQSVIPIDDVFALKKHSPVKVKSGMFEYRCSYKLSNMSLARFVESEQTNVRKQENFNYSIKRYPDTYLSDDDLFYGVADVVSLHQAIGKRLDSDTLSSIPITSTGYVRREAREAVQANPDNRGDLLDSRLSPHTYKLCKAAARGGNTHANYLYIGEILQNVRSKDKKSSYPYQMLSKRYPVGKMVLERGAQDIRADTCNILTVEYDNLMLKDEVYFPYVAKNKCQKVLGRGNLYNNGRIMYAEYVLISMCDIDYQIIEEQYTYTDKRIIELYVTEADYLNHEYRSFIYEMFTQKCELEGGDPYYYNKYKNKINSLFGMMLTDITREEIVYADYEWDSELRPVKELLNEYYRKFSSFLAYQQGLYVTAHARLELQKGFDAVGIDGVYGDTDSVKYLGDYEHAFEKLNHDMAAADEHLDIPVVYRKGDKIWRLGEWEDDGNYAEFKTFGAKKYAYKYAKEKRDKKTGKLHVYGVTVAGLSKERGEQYIEEHGGLESFELGIVFDYDYSGRMTATYNVHKGITPYIYEGHEVEITSNVCLMPTTYTLGLGQEYAAFLEEVRGKKKEE